MKRNERTEYTAIKNSLKKYAWTWGTTLTIRTDAGHEYKQALHELYTAAGFHPASVRVDRHYFDDKERILYIYGLTWELNGEERPWTELYTAEEKARFSAAMA